MSKQFLSTLTRGLAIAMALPLAAAGVHRPALARLSMDAPRPQVVRVQAPKTPAGSKHGLRHQTARAKTPRAPQRPINLNTATVTELLQLPRIGVSTAERIVAFRKEHGDFKRPEEIMNVKGVGEKSFAKLKPFLLVSTTAR